MTSASGAPGVTTTALGLALQWPNEVLLLDADPVGGSAVLAGYYRGTVAHPGTLMQLWDSHRQGTLDHALREVPLRLAEGVSFIPGPAGAAEAAGLAGLWPALTPHLRGLASLDVDVLVDFGRWGQTAAAESLLTIADELLVVLRSDLVAVAAVTAMRLPEDANVGAVVVGPGRPYSTRDLGQVSKLPVRFELPWDPAEAAMLTHGAAEPKRLGGSSKKLRTALKHAAESLVWRRQQSEPELEAV